MHHKIIEKLVPKDTFLYYFMKDCEYNRTPQQYDFWSGMFVLSSLVAHRVKIIDGYTPVMPNLIMFFINEPDVNTNVDSFNIVDSYLTQFCLNDCTIINGYSEIRGITKLLIDNTKHKKQNTLLCTSTSISAFYNNAKHFAYFQDLYNNPTGRKGIDVKYHYKYSTVYCNCLSFGTFMEYCSTIIGDKDTDWTLGSNILIAATDVKKQCDDWVNNGYNPWARNKACEEAKKICEEKPYSLAFEYEAAKFLNAHVRYRTASDTRYTAFFANRRRFAIKFAGLFAINRHALKIERVDVENALYLLRMVQNQFSKYVEKLSNNTLLDTLDKLILAIQKILLKQGDNGIKHAALWQKVRQRCDSETFKHVMRVMFELNLFDKFIMKKGKAVVYMRNVNTQTLELNTIVRKMGEISNV